MQRNGREFTVKVTADGEGLVSHAGTALLTQVSDKTGLTRALSPGSWRRCASAAPAMTRAAFFATSR